MKNLESSSIDTFQENIEKTKYDNNEIIITTFIYESGRIVNKKELIEYDDEGNIVKKSIDHNSDGVFNWITKYGDYQCF